ncbi:MAG TPA: WD40 repeat domain-containing protein [Solirubrobacteraceae bacterium]|jgi:WD40 repeat protein|nr:WD40 repeat domain-containing protein [Solirubrobacteraceae bacterium]
METKRRAYSKWLVYALGLFALGMTAFASVASREHHSTENARNDALSRLVALEARGLQSTNPSLAVQLALVAYRLSGSAEARSALVDATAGEMPTRLLGPVGQTSIGLGDDGHRLAIAYRASGQLKLYSLRYGNLTWLATVPIGSSSNKVDSVAISPGGRLLAIGESRGQVRVWSLASPSHPSQIATLGGGSGAVYGLSFSPGGTALAAADADGSVHRWSFANPGQPVAAPPLVAPGRPALHAISYSHDGNTIAAAGKRGALIVWDAHVGTKPVATLTAGTTTLSTVTYSPDGHTLAAGGQDGVIHLWTLSGAGRPAAARTSLAGPVGVVSLAFSRDGRYVAAGGSNGSLQIWSTLDWSATATLPQSDSVTGVAFTDGDRHLLSSDASGTTLIWQFPPRSTDTTASAVQALTYSPDKPQLAAIGQAGSPAQWDVADEWRPAPVGSWYAPPASAPSTGAYPTTTPTTTTSTGTTTTSATTTPPFNPHAGDKALRQTETATRVVGSALSPNGQLFAAASTDDLVWLWDVSDPSDPKLLAKLAGFTRWAYTVVFSGNSQTLFAGSADHTVRIWDLSNPDVPQELANSPLTGPTSTISELALSPDSRTLAAATTDGRVWLWSVGQPAKAGLLGTLTAASGLPTVTTVQVTAIAFSPSDNTLVAAGSDHRLTFWHYRPYQAVNRICALAGTPITAAEWEQYVPDVPYNPPCENWTPPAPPQTADASH